ncbi:MAG: glycosyltransferase family 2 protein [Actinomycetes bacterium]
MKPAVSVIIPVLNEERFLFQAVSAVLNQQYYSEFEVILALGPSKDKTNEVANDLAKDSRVKLINNPSGKTASALNEAIKASRFDIIVRLDGHAIVDKNYLDNAVTTLLETNADNVGGLMQAEGISNFEKSVAAAMTSKFGVGNAPFHVGGTPGEVDTVYLGTFRKSALERVGYFDESFVRAQDWELNYRIRKTGGKIWFNPKLVVSYRPRPNLKALAKQYFEYGQWRKQVTKKYPETISLRYLAPPITVLGLVTGLIFILLNIFTNISFFNIGWLAIFSYLAVLILGFITIKGKISLKSRLLLFLVLPTMHLSWGVGFLKPTKRL